MQQPLLVASDVDGTLLSDTPVPSDRTRAAVASVIADGTPFVLVTGRPPRWIPPVSKYFPGLRHAVCANGAVLYDVTEDRVLSSVTVSARRLAQLGELALRVLPGCWLAVERPGTGALDERTVPRIQEGYRPDWARDFVTEPLDGLLSEPVIKLLIRHREVPSEQMLATLREHLDQVDGGADAVSLTFSNPNGLVEAAAAGITKETGLTQLAAELGVPAPDVIAFGDMPNDLEMLRWAGHGVAMGNAHPSVLAAADEVTASSAEDGVALVLERWF